jgi:hypothetical protein
MTECPPDAAALVTALARKRLAGLKCRRDRVVYHVAERKRADLRGVRDFISA